MSEKDDGIAAKEWSPRNPMSPVEAERQLWDEWNRQRLAHEVVKLRAAVHALRVALADALALYMAGPCESTAHEPGVHCFNCGARDALAKAAELVPEET